jgi:chromosome segregation ATPase
MAKPLTTTSIDALVEYLKDHGETDSAALAHALGVSDTLIGEWANVLEKSNIVKISYRAAKMYVAPLAISKEGVSILEHNIEIKKENIVNEVNTQLTAINQLNERLDSLNKFVAGGEEIFKRKLGPLKQQLDELHNVSKEAEKRYEDIKKSKNDVDKIAETLNKEISGLKERAEGIEHFELSSNEAERLLEDMNKRLKLMEAISDDTKKKSEEAINDYRKKIDEVANEIKEEIAALRENILTNERVLNDDKRINEEYKRNALKLKKELDTTSSNALDVAEKRKQEIDRYYGLAEKSYNDLTVKLSELKKEIGDITTVDDTLRKVKSTIDEANKKKEELANELNKILNEAKAINALAKEDIVSNDKKVEDLSKDVSKTSSEIRALDDKVSDINKDIGSLSE